MLFTELFCKNIHINAVISGIRATISGWEMYIFLKYTFLKNFPDKRYKILSIALIEMLVWHTLEHIWMEIWVLPDVILFLLFTVECWTMMICHSKSTEMRIRTLFWIVLLELHKNHFEIFYANSYFLFL